MHLMHTLAALRLNRQILTGHARTGRIWTRVRATFRIFRTFLDLQRFLELFGTFRTFRNWKPFSVAA